MSKVWLYFGIGQDGSFVIEDSCYQALRECAPEGKQAEIDDFADLITVRKLIILNLKPSNLNLEPMERDYLSKSEVEQNSGPKLRS